MSGQVKKIKHKKVKEGDILIVVEPTENSVTLTVGEVDYTSPYGAGYFEVENTTVWSDDEDVTIYRIKKATKNKED